MFHNTPLTFFIMTDISHFSKVCVMPLWFDKRLTLITVFANWKKSKKNFCFYEKGWKVKAMFSICFATKPSQCQCAPRAARPALPSSFPRKYPEHPSQHQTSRALNYVWKHLCFVSVYFMRLLARWVLSYQKSLRKVIFSDWEHSKPFPHRLMVTASSTLHQFQLTKSFTRMLSTFG